jgi:hypothetical protein
MAHAIVLDAESRVVEPSSVLRKQPLIVDRGPFATLEPIHGQMLQAAVEHLRKEGIPLAGDPLPLAEISMRPRGGECPEAAELLARANRLRPIGPVVVTDYTELFALAAYLRRHTAEPVRFVTCVSFLARLLETQFYSELPGSLLEGLGKIFAQNVKVYAYSMPRGDFMAALDPQSTKCKVADSGDKLVTAGNLIFEPPANHLYRYLMEGRWVLPLEPLVT